MSNAFGDKKRPAGKQWRSSPAKEMFDNLYKNVEDAFSELESVLNAGWAPVRAATTGNIANLAACPVLQDGVTLVKDDRVLLWLQTDPKENGIYVVGTVAAPNAPLTRATDMAAGSATQDGDGVWCKEGTASGNTEFRVSTAAASVGTNNLEFVRVGTIAQATTEGAFDALAAAGVIDGDRLKASGLTAANFKAALATDAINVADLIAKWVADSVTLAVFKKLLAANSLDCTDADIFAAFTQYSMNAAFILDKVAAGAIPKSKLAITQKASLPDDASVIPAADFVKGVLTAAVIDVGGRTKTTPTAADIVAALPGAGAGTEFEITIINKGVGTITLAMDGTVTNLGHAGDLTLAGGATGVYHVLITGAATADFYKVH